MFDSLVLRKVLSNFVQVKSNVSPTLSISIISTVNFWPKYPFNILGVYRNMPPKLLSLNYFSRSPLELPTNTTNLWTVFLSEVIYILWSASFCKSYAYDLFWKTAHNSFMEARIGSSFFTTFLNSQRIQERRIEFSQTNMAWNSM